jgi:hypothetical protein
MGACVLSKFKPIKSYVGQTEKHKCRRCWRILPHDQFRLAGPESAAMIKERSYARLQLLHPFCIKCCEQREAGFDKHPLYSPKLHRFWERACSGSRSGARQRGIAWCLQVDDAIALYLEQEGKCALTGIELLPETGAGVVNRVRPSIDRISSSGHYTLDNIQIVSAAVNLMKREMSNTEFRRYCRLVVQQELAAEDELLAAI